jgi:death-on-curing protein
MAAAYLFHIVQDYCFVDGNKRVGAMAAFLFLLLNGILLKAPRPAFERLVLSVAKRKSSRAAIAEFFRKHAKA